MFKLFWPPHEGIVSKATNTWEKQAKQHTTMIFKLFWPSHEGIISKSNTHMGKANKATNNKDFQTILDTT